MKTLVRMGLALMALLLGSNLIGSLAWGMDGLDTSAATWSEESQSFHHRWPPHFVPNSQSFWDDSKHWTTNYGPAYRDTIDGLETVVPCTGEYALCFESGPEPLPCKLDRTGRFANCTCKVATDVNYVLISGILNYRVYRQTIRVCGTDGKGCFGKPDRAPVCWAIKRGRLIPGAQVISTFSKNNQSQLATPPSNITQCPKGPYAGCMTAPCRKTGDDEAVCSCPVFWGPFQLYQPGSECTLEKGLVNSASYVPLPISATPTTGSGEADPNPAQ